MSEKIPHVLIAGGLACFCVAVWLLHDFPTALGVAGSVSFIFGLVHMKWQ